MDGANKRTITNTGLRQTLPLATTSDNKPNNVLGDCVAAATLSHPQMHLAIIPINSAAHLNARTYLDTTMMQLSP